MLEKVQSRTMQSFIAKWNVNVTSERSRSGVGGNKLRTYRQFKTTFGTEEYCKIILPRCHRSAFAKFRCGTAPLRIETGRYERLPVNERLCPFCNDKVESEFHTVMECFMYEDIRVDLFEKVSVKNPHFHTMTTMEKFIFIFSNTSCVRYIAKTCFDILKRRVTFLYI
jgi:hypothetical protein